jgi:hypothetical protein
MHLPNARAGESGVTSWVRNPYLEIQLGQMDARRGAHDLTAQQFVVVSHELVRSSTNDTRGRPSEGPAYISMSCLSGIAPPPAFFSGFSAIMASVVRSRPATLAAFCSAERTTLVGSITPASMRSS